MAYVLDFLAIVVADLASISERRTDRFLDAARSHGLNPFLADDPGVDSGHMIAQYTQAAIVSDLKRLANPASVDSIPSSAMQEDHVSMGWSAARKLRKAIDGLTRVLAIEVLTAARGIDMRAPLTPSPATGAVIAAVRARVAGPRRRPSPRARNRSGRRTRTRWIACRRGGIGLSAPYADSPYETSEVVEKRLGRREVAAEVSVLVVAGQVGGQRECLTQHTCEPVVESDAAAAACTAPTSSQPSSTRYAATERSS